MTFKKSRLLLAVFGTLIAASLPILSIGTSSAAGGNGLRVSPVRSDLTIKPGNSQTISITVTNITAQTATLQAVINDFTANPDESGNPQLILNSSQYASSHSLKKFIAPITPFTLAPGEEKNISVVVTIPANAPGGGYYGAVRFAPASSGGPNQTVSLSGSVGSLIIIKVPGNIIDKLSIASFDVRSSDVASSFFTSNKNIDSVVRFQNEGNIQEEPFGKILLKNSSNKILSEFEVNAVSPPGNVLPNSVRKFVIPLSHVGSFGVYKLEGNFGYATNGQLLSASTTFYVVPVLLIILFIAVVIILLFLIFGLPKLIRAYNEKVLRQAGRRR